MLLGISSVIIKSTVTFKKKCICCRVDADLIAYYTIYLYVPLMVLCSLLKRAYSLFNKVVLILLIHKKKP